jgi:hypothetical protein
MPVVVSIPPDPVAGSPPGGLTGASTVTTNVVLNPAEPTAVPVKVPGVVGIAIEAEATLSAPHVTDTEMPATEMSTRSPGVQLETVIVMLPPGAMVGGLTVTTPGFSTVLRVGGCPQTEEDRGHRGESENELVHMILSSARRDPTR